MLNFRIHRQNKKIFKSSNDYNVQSLWNFLATLRLTITDSNVLSFPKLYTYLMQSSKFLVLLNHPHLLCRSKNGCLRFWWQQEQIAFHYWWQMTWPRSVAEQRRVPALCLSPLRSHQQWPRRTSSCRCLVGETLQVAGHACCSGRCQAPSCLPLI